MNWLEFMVRRALARILAASLTSKRRQVVAAGDVQDARGALHDRSSSGLSRSRSWRLRGAALPLAEPMPMSAEPGSAMIVRTVG